MEERLQPEGVEPLLQHQAAFAHLARLDLSESWLDAAAVTAVRAALPNAIPDDQRYNPRYPDDRYIAAGE